MGAFPYRIGLDIGITSVGWSIIEEDVVTNEPIRIEDLGIRIFDRAENPKNGDSLALPRRKARSVRRRLRRRKHRLERIRSLFVRTGLLSKKQLTELYKKESAVEIWHLRAEALSRKLTNEEFARVLIHLAKRRGFKSNRKSEESDKETTKMKASLSENRKLLSEYETVAQMVLSNEKFKNHKRNKGGEYTHTFAREDLEKEIHTIFEKQNKLGHPFATDENKSTYIEIWSSQRPFAITDDVWDKVGECTFELGEKRAPKATYTFQSFMVWDKINKIRLTAGSNERGLSNEEREIIFTAAFSKYKLTYREIRELLLLDDGFERFKGITYDPKNTRIKNEDVVFVQLDELKKLQNLILTDLGAEVYNDLDGEDFDTFGYALTLYKDDKDIRSYLKNELKNREGKKILNLTRKVYEDILIETLLKISFTKFGHLSLKAMKNIMPGLKRGLSYDQACEAAGYNFKADAEIEKQFLLPVIPEVANPVVMRALTQSRKVVNAIIKRYGSPTSIHVELAREMQKNFDERKKSTADRDHNNIKNRSAIEKLLELGLTTNPRGHDIVKMKLYSEQQGVCAYTLERIDPNRLLEPGYVEVDHILPYSRSLDNGYKNKVLVFGRENQNKQNRTPFEYFGENKEKWDHFAAFVNSNPNYSKEKRARLTRTHYLEREEKEFRERNLNDTRYAARFFSQFLRDNLYFAPSKYNQKVFVANGSITAYLRSRWDFNKDREASDLHHAADAVIVACATHMVQKVTRFHQQRENNKKLAQRNKQYFPQPWEGFSDELKARLSENPKQGIESLNLVHYDPKKLESLEPVFVSRKPRRSVTGPLHEETFRRIVGEENGKKLTAVKTKLEDIPFDKDGHFPMYGKETDPATYNAIRERFLEHQGNKKAAFKEKLFKPTKNGEVGNQIKTVRILDVANQVHTVHENNKGVYNSNIIRTDVFEKDGKFFCVPIYTFDVAKGVLPKMAINANKPYSEWTEMTEDFFFKFSLYPNDVVFLTAPRIKKYKTRNKEEKEFIQGFLYYRGIDSANGGLTLLTPSGDAEIRGLGSKTLQRFEKYQVDILGNLVRVREEKRVELAASYDHKKGEVVSRT